MHAIRPKNDIRKMQIIFEYLFNFQIFEYSVAVLAAAAAARGWRLRRGVVNLPAE